MVVISSVDFRRETVGGNGIDMRFGKMSHGEFSVTTKEDWVFLDVPWGGPKRMTIYGGVVDGA